MQPPAPALAALARLLAESRPFAARMRDVFQVLRQAVPFHEGRLIFRTLSDTLVEQVATPEQWPLPWNDDVTAQVVRRLAAVRVTEPAQGADGALPQMITSYSAPVAWAGECLGVLELRGAGEYAFTPGEQSFIGALLPVLAAAITSEGSTSLPSLPRTTDLSLRQVSALGDVRQSLEEPHTLQDTLWTILHWALETTGSEAGMLATVDHERRELHVHVHEGYPADPTLNELEKRRWRMPLAQGLAGRAARTGRPLLMREFGGDDTPTAQDIRSEMAVPVVYEGRVLAVLVLDSVRSAAFGEREQSLIQTLCQLAVQPIRRGMVYQDALETSKHLSQAFLSIPSGLALLNHQGSVLRHNQAWLAIWGIDAPIDETFDVPWDLVPRLLGRLTDPLALSEFCADGQASPDQPTEMMLTLREPHQELHILSVPTRDTQDTLTGRLWIVSDLTREREADRLKNEFIAIVSHELRTPLTSILGYTELLLAREFEPAERREFVQTVYDQSEHLSQIVEDLLGMSRIESGKVKVNQWVIGLRQVAAELSSQLGNLLVRHRLVLDIPQQPLVYIDRDKVKQILTNLISNAVKYSPNGGEIAITARPASVADLPADHAEGAFMLVRIRDQGMGIGPEDLPRIWERFYRVDNSNTRRIGGTGLGLAITKALVELHEGMIWVESEVGVGSTFSFTLPIAQETPVVGGATTPRRWPT